MPLGVDHLVRAIADDEAIGVPLPLMPLGVDHKHILKRVLNLLTVPLPLMPLGVDHGHIHWSDAVDWKMCLYL